MRPLEDGATVRDHGLSAQRQFAKLGIKPKVAPAPDGPPFPAALAYLWRMFAELVIGLPSGGFGPAVVTWETLRAWCALMRVTLRPWEALALVRLGEVRARVIGDAIKAARPAGQT
jgi:hypothetical protein